VNNRLALFLNRANYIHIVLNQFSLGKTEETKPVCKELQSQVFSLMLFRPSLVNVHKEIGTIEKSQDNRFLTAAFREKQC